MALVKGRGWNLRRKASPPEPPGPQSNIDDLIAQFHKNGGLLRMEVKGNGVYTLARGESYKGYPLIVYWKGSGGRSAVNHSYGNPAYGRQVMISPYSGRRPDPFKYRWTEDSMLRWFIPIIQSGIHLSQLDCGDKIGHLGYVPENIRVLPPAEAP